VLQLLGLRFLLILRGWGRVSRERFWTGLFCGLVSAGLSTWLTSDPVLIAAVGIVVTLFVWLFGGLLMVMLDD
jgi:hypothetical protein